MLNLNPMIRPKEKRNNELVRLRDRDPRKWTFDALGEKYGIAPATAFEIYHREKARMASKKTKVPVPSFIAKKYPALVLHRRVFNGRSTT